MSKRPALKAAQAVEQRLGEVDALNPDPALGEEERVAAHPATDFEHALPRLDPGEADEIFDMAVEIRRAGGLHAALLRGRVVAALRLVVLFPRVHRAPRSRPASAQAIALKPSRTRPSRP